MGEYAAYAALVVGAGSAIDQREKSRSNLNRQDDIQDKEDAKEESRKVSEEAKLKEGRRRQVREGRVRRAQLVAQGTNQGSSGSSGELGALSALASNIQGNIGFQHGQSAGIKAISNLNQGISDIQGDIIKTQGSASNTAAVGALAGLAFQASGGFDSVFKKKPEAQLEPEDFL